MTLKRQLLLISGGAFSVLFAVLAYALYALDRASEETDHLIGHEVSAQLAYTNLYASGLQAASSMRSVVLDPKNEVGYANLKRGLDDFDAALALAKSIPPTESQKPDALRSIETMHAQRKQLIERATTLVRNDVPRAMALLNDEEIPLWRKIRDVLLEQVKAARTDMDAARQEGADAAHRVIAVVGVCTLLALIFGGVCLALLVRRLDSSLGGDPVAVAAAAAAVAQGDLSQALPGAAPGSVIESMRRMQGQLVDSVTVIRAGAEQLNVAAERLNDNETGVAERVQQQSDKLAEIAAAVEQLTTSIRVVADLGSETNSLAQGAGQQAGQGVVAIERVLTEMNAIQRAVDRAATVIAELGRESESIASVVGTIREIADQTNLLALNAAIEAARAGEQGRGFAVVADEVRKLAERTTTSTGEIGATIARVRAGIGEATGRMNEGVDIVASGRTLANDAGAVMQTILHNAEEVVRTVHEMAHSVSEQSTVSTQIAQRIEAISLASEDNMRAVDEAVGATQRVNTLAHQLTDSVRVFRLPA